MSGDVVSDIVDTNASGRNVELGDDRRELEDDEYEDDDEEEDEEEAEAIARRLKEQLWADISKAQAAQASASVQSITAVASAAITTKGAPPAPRITLSKKEEAALGTMRSILEITAKDTLARSTLASAVVPGSGESVLDVLSCSVATGSISKDLAKTLGPILVSLARSDTLFATLRHSNAPAIQLDKGKRKRDDSEQDQNQGDFRSIKRPNIVHHDFQRQVTDAAQVVANALATNPPSNGPLDPLIISSIQLQLHQIFLFAMTSSVRGGPEMHTLQEIGGLIQVVGVLSGIQIGPTAPQNAQVHLDHQAPGPGLYPPRPWIPPGANPNPSFPFSDIGTAVYPCLMSSCRKTFSRLYGLRAHQRVHATHRPFRCAACPASFARNHDLKRHAKLHEKKAWQCAGCDKMFSRRDAIKRHKNSAASRGGKGEPCVDAAIREVEVDKEGDEEAVKEGRRTRMWADIVSNNMGAIAPPGGYGDDGGMEEGEVHNDVIRHVQAAVLSLHGTLQAHVSRALGTDHSAPPLHLDPTGGQATLASVIARAQMQNMTPQFPPHISPVGGARNAGGNDPQVSFRNNDVGAGGGPPDSMAATDSGNQADTTAPAPQLSLYGLSEEQAKLLEQAIANAASAAQAQAEAEAALEEEDDDCDEGDEDDLNEIDGTISSGVVPQASSA